MAHNAGKDLTMKKIIAILLASLLVFGAIACTKSSAPAAESKPEATAEPESAPVAGGWQIAESNEITDEIRSLLASATDGMVGAGIEPAAYLGSQLVAGRNHCLLCVVTPVVPDPVPHYALVYLYEALDGTVTLMNIADLDLGALKTGSTGSAPASTESELVPGGWGFSTDELISEEQKALYEKSVTASDYTAVAHLGSQIVSGLNHCYLAVNTSAGSYQLIYVYEKPNGEVDAATVVPFDIGEFAQYGE